MSNPYDTGTTATATGIDNPHSDPQAFDQSASTSPHQHGDILIVSESADSNLVVNDDYFLEVYGGSDYFAPTNPYG